LINYANALAPEDALALRLGVAERCGDRREALLKEIVPAIPTIDNNAISRFELALRAFRLRASDDADQAELDTLIAVVRREGKAADYFGLERERLGLPRALIQDALENALTLEQPAWRFGALEALAVHLDVGQLGHAWDELDQIRDASVINDAKLEVFRISVVAGENNVDGGAWLVDEDIPPGRAAHDGRSGRRQLLSFLLDRLEILCLPKF
jgi:hypothetical protein